MPYFYLTLYYYVLYFPLHKGACMKLVISLFIICLVTFSVVVFCLRHKKVNRNRMRSLSRINDAKLDQQSNEITFNYIDIPMLTGLYVILTETNERESPMKFLFKNLRFISLSIPNVKINLYTDIFKLQHFHLNTLKGGQYACSSFMSESSERFFKLILPDI